MIKALVIEEFKLFDNPLTLKSQINSTFPSVAVISIIELSAHLSYIPHIITMQSPGLIHHKGQPTISIDDEHKQIIRGSKHRVDAFLHLKYWVLMNKNK